MVLWPLTRASGRNDVMHGTMSLLKRPLKLQPPVESWFEGDHHETCEQRTGSMVHLDLLDPPLWDFQLCQISLHQECCTESTEPPDSKGPRQAASVRFQVLRSWDSRPSGKPFIDSFSFENISGASSLPHSYRGEKKKVTVESLPLCPCGPAALTLGSCQLSLCSEPCLPLTSHPKILSCMPKICSLVSPSSSHSRYRAPNIPSLVSTFGNILYTVSGPGPAMI